MKARVLVTGEEGTFKDTFNFVISRDYINALSAAGLMPMLALDIKSAEAYTEQFDGLFLTGGPDIHCWRYGDVYADASHIRPMSRTRDDLEFTLCRHFLAAGKPIFGVGRGLQVINVALGGRLYQHLPEHPGALTAGNAVTERAEPAYHSVQLAPESRLASVLGEELRVNSCHHQGVKTLGAGLMAAAAADGVIEAIEHESLPVFGLQWHPERGDVDPRPFSYFAALCREVEA